MITVLDTILWEKCQGNNIIIMKKAKFYILLNYGLQFSVSLCVLLPINATNY